MQIECNGILNVHFSQELKCIAPDFQTEQRHYHVETRAHTPHVQ